MELEKYWAKTNPRQSVVTHGLVSGHVAQVIFDRYLSPSTKKLLDDEIKLDADDVRAFLGYFVSLHDIGKIEFSFQYKDPSSRESLNQDPEDSNRIPSLTVRHERTGERCVKNIWDQAHESRRLAGILSKVIGAHHPGRIREHGFVPDSLWYDRQKEYEALMRNRFLGKKPPVIPEIDNTEKGVIGAVLLSVLILSDWIASGPAFADAEDWITCPDAEKRIVDTAESFFERSGLRPHRVRWPDRFCGLWTGIPEEGKRPLQTAVETLFDDPSSPYRLILLEAPMGEGKTEAGVFAALQMAKQWGKDGFYFALPTAATSNQMVGRMRALLHQHDLDDCVLLLHAMSWLEHSDDLCAVTDEETDGIANWLAPVRRGLLGQYAVGTVDQAMLAATTVKYGALRLLGLSNKVLIIDEIHSYDAYMSEILKRLLEWCKVLKIPVVMLSATLPPEKKRDLFSPLTKEELSKGYPLITAIRADGTVREKVVEKTVHSMTSRLSLIKSLNSPEMIAGEAEKAVKEGGCLCVLMNTVKEAQRVYAELKKRWDGDLLLFHAQFPIERRAEIEKECIRRFGKDKTHRPERSILVATQVVEQSLDVDFDAMLTAVAPIDLLLQRLGRVHRHGETPRPDQLKEPLFGVLIPSEESSFGSSGYVYPECLLKSSIRILQKMQIIRIPDDIAPMVRDGYDPVMVPEEDLQQWIDNVINEQVEAGATQQFLVNSPTQQYNALIEDAVFDDEGQKATASTRLGEPTVRIALLEPGQFEQLIPFISDKNGVRYAEIRKKAIAEMVMRRSVTISNSRFQREMVGYHDLQGDILLNGTKIIRVEDGKKELPNGKTLYNDPELGVIIKEGEI